MVYQNYSIAHNINDNFACFFGATSRSMSGPYDGLNDTASTRNSISSNYTWVKPKGTKFVFISLFGGGGGGSGGAASPSGYAAGGGAGGNSGPVLHALFPSFMIPDIMYPSPAFGGQGGQGGILGVSGTGVSVSGSIGGVGEMSFIANHIADISKTSVLNRYPNYENCLIHLIRDNFGVTTRGGTSGAGGTQTGGTSYSPYSNAICGFLNMYSGREGGAFGTITTSGGNVGYQTYKIQTRAAGGGGVSSTALNGGGTNNSLSMSYWNTLGDTAPSPTSGQDGFGTYYGPGSISNGCNLIFSNYLPHFGIGVAQGGAGNIGGNGGHGGQGYFSSGGGGGGGAVGSDGVKAGNGGSGGPGAVFIWSIK